MSGVWDPKSPIWRLFNLIVVMFFVWLFAWSNASDFDETEIKMLIELACVMGGMEFVKSRVQKEKS